MYNSSVISILSTALALAVGLPATYALARFRFRFPPNKDITIWFISQRVLPPAAAVVPFFMIWNIYPSKLEKKWDIASKAIRLIGVIILIIMFLLFSGKDYEGNDIGFAIHWWGILGLIGWVYLIAASAFIFIRASIIGSFIAFFICETDLNG